MDLIRRFLYPHESVSDLEVQRQSRLLLVLTGVVVVFGGIGSIFYYIASIRRGIYQQDDVFLLVALILVVSFAFILARRGLYKYGAGVISIILILMILSIGSYDPNFLPFLILAMIFGSIFLSIKGLLVLFTLSMGGVLFVSAIVFDLSVIDVLGGVGSFMIVNTTLLVLSIYQRQLIETDRRNVLEEKNLELKEEVKARRFAEEELEKKIHDLEILNEATVGRELRMKELKEKLTKAKGR